MSFRVDNVPLLLKPLFYAYAYGSAALMYFFLAAIRCTVRVRFEGEAHPPPHANHIYATWHENLVPYFVVYRSYREPYAWLNHPLWFMKPVHLLLRWMGLKNLFLGSSGHGGRLAMLQVVEALKQGSNTMLNPDGPAGPYRQLKPGALEMSRLSGIPVVPLRFELSHFVRLRGWDKKKIPLPFSTIRVIYGKPVCATENEPGEAAAALAMALG